MAVCAFVPGPTDYAGGMLAYLDCQAQTLGTGGYAALAAPGSIASSLLLALLTILIALFGYRMLLGHVPDLREGTVSFAKIAIVLALTIGWPAYQILIYNVVLHAPSELAAAIGRPTGLYGADGGLAARIDGVDGMFHMLAIYGIGPLTMDAAAQARGVRLEPSLWGGFDTFAIGMSRLLFLGSAIGAFAIARLVAGLLLALGPIFLAFLLFRGTQGLFEGWLRGLLAAALAAFGTTIVLGIELVLLEPWLASLIARRAANGSIVGEPVTLLVTTGIFAFVLLCVLIVLGKVAWGFRLPNKIFGWQSADLRTTRERTAAPSTGTTLLTSMEARSRAAALADSITVSQRREEKIYRSGKASMTAVPGAAMGDNGSAPMAQAMPLGQSHRRRNGTRISPGAKRRDRTG